MKLTELQIQGYKCFRDITKIPIQNLSVLIGENDSGKSSILKALELLLSKLMPKDEDYFALNDVTHDEFTIIGKFILSESDNKDQLKNFVVDNELVIKKVFKKSEAFKTFNTKSVFQDEKLENYSVLDATETKQLLIDLNIAMCSNQQERHTAIKEYIELNNEILPKTTKEVEISFNTISPYIPIFQYYGSHIYGNPQALVKKTLDDIYSSYFYDEAGDLKIQSLKGLKQKALTQLNKHIKENLLAKIKVYNPKVSGIQGRLDIDFSRGLDFQGLELDDGNGFKLIDQKGEGSKKKLFLSILEWDKEVQKDLVNSRSVMRVYDEPDTSLHYDAQRKMFNAISEVANNPKSNTQAIIATHSIVMVDRSPAKSIIQVVQENGCSEIDFLKSDDNQDISDFLGQISLIGGIKNSSIFYEKCFLIVEGESEENAIPKIYKKLFGRTLSEYGIVLINLHSNGAWYNFLKLLNNNKKHCTVMLLDNDTQNPNCGANVTTNKLNEIGFDAVFLSENVFFVGLQEFEDVFPNNRIKDIFNNLYPKPTGKWEIHHIASLRASHPKISKGFYEESKKFIAHHHKHYRKPEFANEIAEAMTKKELEQISVLTNLFGKVHEIVG